MATLLIKQDDLSKNTPIGGNVQTSRIVPAIKSAQITKIKPLLGRNLYKKIVKDFEDDTLADQYLELYEDYIVPMLIHVSASHYFSYGAYNISDKGIYKAVGSDSEGVSKNEVDYLVKAQEGLYEDFKTGFYSFMDFNYKIFPEWERVTTRTKSFGGWTLGDSKITNNKGGNTKFDIKVEWGKIIGTLTNQIDLINALNDKVDKASGERLINSSEITKLVNIEANADITDTENVRSSGALMDDEVANLAQVKDFDSSDYANAVETTNEVERIDDILIDKVDKANGERLINSSEITKLVNIEANADITDTENVRSSGALMDDEVANLAQVKDFDSSDYANAVETTNALNDRVKSVTASEPVGSDVVANIVSLTQAEYDAATPISTTFYIITD